MIPEGGNWKNLPEEIKPIAMGEHINPAGEKLDFIGDLRKATGLSFTTSQAAAYAMTAEGDITFPVPASARISPCIIVAFIL